MTPDWAGPAFDLARRSVGSVSLDWLDGDVRELRERYERANRVEDRGAHEWRTIEQQGRRLKLLIQHPRNLSNPDCIIVYFHGGGWIVGSPLTHADISRALCERTGLRLVSVDYRLAPEFVAPAPVEDGLAALSYIFDAGIGGRGIGSAILCGDSAGGAIALAVERHAEPAVRTGIIGVCSLYGFFGLLDSVSLVSRGSHEDGLDRDCVKRMWSLANEPDTRSPYSVEALGVYSPTPAYLIAASEDPVLDDTLALAISMKASGRPYILDQIEGETHGFLHEAGKSEKASASLERLSSWMSAIGSAAVTPYTAG